MVDVGRKMPAGMRSAKLVISEAVPSSGAPQIQRAEFANEDHTDRVPEKSFVNDLKRKLSLKNVMGKRREEEKEELPPEGLKFTKEEVNYRYAAEPKRSCGDCKYYVDNGSCEIVSGLIRRVDTCDRFTPEENGMVRATAIGLAEAQEDYVGFDALTKQLGRRKGVKDPGALAAWIGRNKYGAKGMAAKSKAGREDEEVTPPGYEHIVRALKKKYDPKSGAPWAIAWWMKGQGIKPKPQSEGGPGSGPQGGKRSKFAPEEHEPDEPIRVESPRQRAVRMRQKKVSPDRAAVIRKALGSVQTVESVVVVRAWR